MTAEAALCCVCQEPLTATSQAYCMVCGRDYHLNQRSDIPGKDCGQVWVHEENLSLEFACDLCLSPPAENVAALDDILDAAEAALEAQVSEGWLVEEAIRGNIRFRRTGSGVYLFQRADVIAYRQGRR